MPSKPLSTQASVPWHPQRHHVMVRQAGVRYGKEGRSTARPSPISSFLRDFFILLHGNRAMLPFGQAHGEGSFKKPCWEERGMCFYIYSTYREVLPTARGSGNRSVPLASNISHSSKPNAFVPNPRVCDLWLLPKGLQFGGLAWGFLWKRALGPLFASMPACLFLNNF